MRNLVVAIAICLCHAVPVAAETVLTAGDRPVDLRQDGTYGFLDGVGRRDTEIAGYPTSFLHRDQADRDPSWTRFVPGFDLLGEIRILRTTTRDLFFNF